ncbi:MAG: FkbM family methyltransferase [Phycisphaerales bacterium]
MTGLTPDDLRHLDAAVANARRGPLGKLGAAPLRLGYSKVMEAWCRWRGTAVRRTARTFWGEPMAVAFPDPVSLTIYRYGYFEEELTRVFIEILRPGMTFFDVGSHFGFFSLLALRLVGPSGRVVAFEPTPTTREMLERNIGGRPNASIVPMAAYREDTTLTLHDFGVRYSAFNSIYSGKMGTDERRAAEPVSFSVPATTIDGFVASSGVAPDVLKIDTEGAELDVLAGMERLLTGRDGLKRPMLTLEVGDVGGPDISPSRGVVQAILSHGYQGYEVREGRLVEHTPRDRYEYTNLLFRPD